MPLPSQVYSKQSAKQKEATYISSSFFNLWLEFLPLHIHFPHLSIHLWQFICYFAFERNAKTNDKP